MWYDKKTTYKNQGRVELSKTCMATLFLIDRTWKQLRCSSAGEQVNRLVYPHNRMLLSAEKK